MRTHGKGSIEQLERGKPRGRCRRWRLWVSTDAGRRSRRFEGTWRGAERALEAFRDELEGEVPNSETFAAYAASWAAWRRSSGQYEPGTLEGDARNVRALCRTALAGMAMDAITPVACKEALVEARDNPARGGRLSGTTMNKMHSVLSAIMATAHADGLIGGNPMDGIAAPRIDTDERTWMGASELDAFIAAVAELPPDGRTMAVMLMAQLGLRRGEACALADADVDTHAKVAHVHEAVKERDGTVGKPKTKAGVRDLPMPDALCSYVERWRAVRVSKGYADARTLCCNARGGVLRPQNLQQWWNANRDGLGACGYTLHQLRHSNLSKMARYMSPFDLKTWAGWSSIAPAKIYIHDDMSSLRAAVARSQVHGVVHLRTESAPPSRQATSI